MLRHILVVVISAVFLLSGFKGARAEELQMESFLYTEGFEETNPILFWTTDGEYEENYDGLTEEKAFSGKKSYKLDVTIKKGSYVYWRLPVRVPAEGKLKFSARLLVEKETTGRLCLGANFIFPPIPDYSAYHEGLTFGPSGGEWRLIEADLIQYVKELPGKGVSSRISGAGVEDVGVYLNMIGLALRGGERSRVVFYLDDIKIEGQVPNDTSYKNAIDRRWGAYQKRIEEKISFYEESLEKARKKLDALTCLSESAKKMRKDAEEKLTSFQAKVSEMKVNKCIASDDAGVIELYLKQFGDIIEIRRNNGYGFSEGNGLSIASAKFNKGKSVVCHGAEKEAGQAGVESNAIFVYAVSAITSTKILPSSFPVPGSISHNLSLVACPGEYEPVSFVLHPLEDITDLQVMATQLKGKEGSIPSENIDIRIVKCWYQAGTAWVGIEQNRAIRVLVPELLLKDDSLVRVDMETKQNYLKLSYPEGDKYVCISKEEGIPGISTSPSVEEFPVKDSPVLLPINIPAKTNKQFWITVKVPDNASPGMYEGRIELRIAQTLVGEINLKLRVLPIKLSRPYYTSSIYYTSGLGSGSISSSSKNKDQIRKELENLFAHGVTNPICYQSIAGLAEVLKLREEVGMDNSPLYYIGYPHWEGIPIDLVPKVIELAKDYGTSEVYFYGKDEARGQDLTAQGSTWDMVHKVGGKIFAAGYIGSNFEKTGDIQDLLICAGYPSKKESAKWHSVGRKIWSYANPQGGVENPEIYRRNYGFLLWKNNYDGAATFAYQCNFGNIWNDFDHPSFRDHNLTYPTADGVIDTIAWEGYREGVDDVRYLSTLLNSIKKAKATKNASTKEIVKEVEGFLDGLDAGGDLDTIRLEIISYILRLRRVIK